MCNEPDIGGTLTLEGICAAGLTQYREAVFNARVSGEPVECLLAHGLLRRIPDDVCLPVPPGIAKSTLSRPMEEGIENYRRSLAALHSSFLEVDSLYREVQSQVGIQAEPLDGVENIRESLQLAVESCTYELLTAQPGGGRAPELLAEALQRDLDLALRGVSQRTIYQHTVRTHSPTLAYIEQVMGVGGQVRTLDEVFERIIICDRTVAFIPGRADRRVSAIAVRDPSMVEFLAKGFDRSWERSIPMALSPGLQRPEALTNTVRRAVLRMVIGGHTDESIAARLGMSSRTVSAHIKKISEIVGSRSRAELGYLVAQKNILNQETEPPYCPDLDSSAGLGR